MTKIVQYVEVNVATLVSKFYKYYVLIFLHFCMDVFGDLWEFCFFFAFITDFVEV